MNTTTSTGSPTGTTGRRPNDALRQARLALRSPTDPGRAMSRQELAEAINAYVYEQSGHVCHLDDKYIAGLERGHTRWPLARNREALRAILGAATDADLGLYPADRANVPTARRAAGPVTGPDMAGVDLSGMQRHRTERTGTDRNPTIAAVDRGLPLRHLMRDLRTRISARISMVVRRWVR